jgi:hypothetical protein
MKAHRTLRRTRYLGQVLFVLWMAGLCSACGNEGSGLFPAESDFRFGVIVVKAFDQRNAPVAGAAMELRDSRNTLLWGDLNQTGADGSVSFSALSPGSYTITIQPPAGYAVPASQLNPIGVEVGNSQSITLNVSLIAE